MLNKVILVRPRNVYHYNNYPALNLISIGSLLKQKGYDVRLLNCAFERNPFAAIKKELDNCLFAGISLLTSEAMQAYDIASFISNNSDVPVVVGGAHCTLFPEQMLKSEYVDFVVAGEGESHILDIADNIKNGQNGKNRIFPKKIFEIENLPIPDYSIDGSIEKFIKDCLTDKLYERAKKPMRWLPYESSRGCPGQCAFCINAVTDNRRYRKKSAQKVLDESSAIIKKYKLTHLKFIDDNFFVDIERVREIAEGIIKSNLDITWDAECRCDYFNDNMINDRTLSLLKRSGLIQLTLGIESGSQRSLDIMKKGITLRQAEYAIERCDKYGIIARSSFIIEVPGETIGDIKKSIAFINRLRRFRNFTCGIGTFRPYPKCELTTQLISSGYLKQPRDFKGWTDKTIIDMYTSAEYIRPWQVNGSYSESAAYYLNMESAVRLGNYQIKERINRVKNTIFTLIAKLRNRVMFYRLGVDKLLYKKFLTGFYKKRQKDDLVKVYNNQPKWERRCQER